MRETKIEAVVFLLPIFGKHTLLYPHCPNGHTGQPCFMWEGTTQGCEFQEVKITEGHLGNSMYIDVHSRNKEKQVEKLQTVSAKQH